ncbi:MAG: S8 family serine peptidase [Planctomycetota bacterium]|nr:S8 family serine peptidase [Planctomycetota bacterium]
MHRAKLIAAALLTLTAAPAMLRADPTTSTATNTPAATQPAPPSNAAPSNADLIGLTRLAAELGPRLPTGRGIVFGHVEGGGADYLPNTAHRVFEGVTFHTASGSAKTNAHADATARILYGRSGLAPGVEQVYCYAAGHWLGPGLFRARAPLPPHDPIAHVYTNSWITDAGKDNTLILRRADYVVDHCGTFLIAGVNNQKTSGLPPLLGSAYNAIAVGHYDGQSSGGFTTADGEVAGRCKPDIVAPGGLTSFATPVVASVVARLLEAAGGPGISGGSATVPATRPVATQPGSAVIPGIDAVARRPEVIKAILLAGASKPAAWHALPGKPLDEHLGAGRVRLDASYHILAAGRVFPVAADAPAGVKPRGWSYASLAPGGHHDYALDPGPIAGEVSIILTWHRRIMGRMVNDLLTDRPYWLDAPRLADLDLELLAVPAQGEPTVVARSESRIDNVEHVYLPSLAAVATQPSGAKRWVIRVTRHDTMDEEWDYAVAWRVEETANRAVMTQPAATRPAATQRAADPTR